MRAMTLPGAFLFLAAILGTLPTARAAAQRQKKDYLTETESDKIREAGDTGPRIGLFATFAADRIKKIQYELAHIDPADERRADRLNDLILGYTGCVDDAADLVEIGIEKQQDIRAGVKLMAAKLKEFLPYLQGLATNGADRETYKSNLDDAIVATQDAQKDVDRATKENPAAPVRRKPT